DPPRRGRRDGGGARARLARGSRRGRCIARDARGRRPRRGRAGRAHDPCRRWPRAPRARPYPRCGPRPRRSHPVSEMTALQLLGPSTGGIRVHVATLAAGLEDLGVRAPVVGPRGVLDGLGPQAGEVPVPAGLSPLGWWRARTALRPWRGEADVVHTHGLKAAWTALGGRPRRPIVCTVHNVVLDESAGRLTRIQRPLERQVLQRVDRVVALTTSMAEELGAFVPAERLRVALPASRPPEPSRPAGE